MTQDSFFFNLTPDIIIKAVEESGFEPTGHCMALNSYENRVYDLRLEDGSHVVSKFYRPGRWSREQILEEHAFLLELRADEIPVCAPLRFHDGATLHEIEGIYYAVWPRTGGRVPDELSDIELQILGRLCARIHNNGAAGAAPHRIELTGDTYGLQPLSFLEEAIPACRRAAPTGTAARCRRCVHLRDRCGRTCPFTGSTATATWGTSCTEARDGSSLILTISSPGPRSRTCGCSCRRATGRACASARSFSRPTGSSGISIRRGSAWSSRSGPCGTSATPRG